MPEETNYKVFFTENIRNHINYASKYIQIAPDHNNWNDFGMDGKIEIFISDYEKRIEIPLSGFIGFLQTRNEKNGKYELNYRLERDYFRDENNPEIMNDIFIMLRELKDYRILVEKLGVEEAKKILELLNDVTITTLNKSKMKSRESALKSDIFNKSFIRNSESYFAFKNAAAILKGLIYEELGVLSNTLKIQYEINNTSEKQVLNFTFEHRSELPKRVAILIGENGIGKSQTLRNIALAAIRGSSNLSEMDVDEQKGERIQISRLLAFAPTNESKSVFPSDKNSNSHIFYKRFTLNREYNRKGKSNVSDIILQVARIDERISGSDRWSIFLNAIETLNKSKDIVLPCSSDEQLEYIHVHGLRNQGEERRLETFKAINQSKEPMRLINGKLHPLSSGEISFIKFCAQACLYIENGTLLLLDEPETHLHPAFINKFFSILDSLLSQTGSSAIMATHSVYFVREVFKEQVTVLRRTHQGEIISEKPRLSTFGADIGNISYFVFGENEETKTLIDVKENIVNNYKNWSDVYNKFKNDISINTLTMLREFFEKKQR